MDISNKRSQDNRFELKATEIDRIMDELDEVIASEPVERKDALRLKLILEETMLHYMESCPEGTTASLRFSHTFGTFRVSFKVEGDSFDPFSANDPLVTSVMGSLLANSDTLNRAWKYRGGANLVTFTLMRKRKIGLIVSILIGVASGIAAGFLIRAIMPGAAGDIAERIVAPLTNAFVGLSFYFFDQFIKHILSPFV